MTLTVTSASTSVVNEIVVNCPIENTDGETLTFVSVVAFEALGTI